MFVWVQSKYNVILCWHRQSLEMRNTAVQPVTLGPLYGIHTAFSLFEDTNNMTFTKRMHPRNKYRSPPNFRELAIEFEEFRQYAIQDLTGKVTVDFKNAEALRALTRALLKKDWDLDVHIPPDRLVPTLPLRLNYLLWIEDLLMSVGKDIIKTPVHGIDIGTGAACVYPLLAARKNKWHMLATEVDKESVNHAISNVQTNNLLDLIQVQPVSGEHLLKEAIEKSDKVEESNKIIYDFCMCNPPFYSNEDEIESSSTGRSPIRPRNPPRNARTGSMREVIFEGGEVAFVTKMIEEGKLLQNKIRILTTMLGHKSSVPKVSKILDESGVKNIIQTEFCQGRTMRWGIAWSHSVDLSSVSASPITKKEKPRPPQQYTVPENCGSTLEDVANRITNILDTISVRHKLLEKTSNTFTYKVTALENTWSNQRRKRREKRLKEKANLGEQSEEGMAQPPSDTETSSVVGQKRTLEDGEGNSDSKRIKVDVTSPLLVMTLVVKSFKIDAETEQSRFALEVYWLDGTGGRELPNQVLQYIKNNLRPAEEAVYPQ